jgi:hypothetical protein
MEATFYSETSVDFQRNTIRHIAEYRTPNDTKSDYTSISIVKLCYYVGRHI